MGFLDIFKPTEVLSHQFGQDVLNERENLRQWQLHWNKLNNRVNSARNQYIFNENVQNSLVVTIRTIFKRGLVQGGISFNDYFDSLNKNRKYIERGVQIDDLYLTAKDQEKVDRIKAEALR